MEKGWMGRLTEERKEEKNEHDCDANRFGLYTVR